MFSQDDVNKIVDSVVAKSGAQNIDALTNSQLIEIVKKSIYESLDAYDKEAVLTARRLGRMR